MMEARLLMPVVINNIIYFILLIKKKAYMKRVPVHFVIFVDLLYFYYVGI